MRSSSALTFSLMSSSSNISSKTKNNQFISLFFILFIQLVQATLSPPSSVTWTANPLALLPTIQSGRIAVSWSPAIGSVDSYQVVVAPLDYTDALTDPVYSGFVLVSILKIKHRNQLSVLGFR